LTICGDKGFLRLHGRFHHAERFTVVLNDGGEQEFHFPRIGNGYAHEAMEVGRCLREGLLESPEMPLDESVSLMGVLDDLRAQLGLRYVVD
jgi:predicted dehydrogenase